MNLSGEPETISDRKTYKVLRAIQCCYNCRHSYTRAGVVLYCYNRQEWVKETCVEPLGLCDGYRRKEYKNEI